jgi:hypothetical protein
MYSSPKGTLLFFAHVQAWVFETKITTVISVNIGIQRSDDKKREGYEHDWALESIMAAVGQRKDLFFFRQKSNPDCSMLNLAA